MDSVYLQGSEDVRSAGHSIQNSAVEMKHAASSISFALEQHERFLSQWLAEFKDIMAESSVRS
jgi:hypothetical protein